MFGIPDRKGSGKTIWGLRVVFQPLENLPIIFKLCYLWTPPGMRWQPSYIYMCVCECALQMVKYSLWVLSELGSSSEIEIVGKAIWNVFFRFNYFWERQYLKCQVTVWSLRRRETITDVTREFGKDFPQLHFLTWHNFVLNGVWCLCACWSHTGLQASALAGPTVPWTSVGLSLC